MTLYQGLLYDCYPYCWFLILIGQKVVHFYYSSSDSTSQVYTDVLVLTPYAIVSIVTAY